MKELYKEFGVVFKKLDDNEWEEHQQKIKDGYKKYLTKSQKIN